MTANQTIFTAFGEGESVFDSVAQLEDSINEQLGEKTVESISHSSYESGDAFVATAVVVARDA